MMTKYETPVLAVTIWERKNVITDSNEYELPIAPGNDGTELPIAPAGNVF